MAYEQPPFVDLPAALVEDILGQATFTGDLLIDRFRSLKIDREGYRRRLQEKNLIIHESSLGYPPLPTTCGTDGSYAIERLLFADLTAAAAVAVEGLTPPSEKRHWDQPHHLAFVQVEPHNPDTSTVLRAVMLGKELILATSAPHDLVLLDQTLTLPIIYFNQALGKAPSCPELRCSQEFMEHGLKYLESYRGILRPQRSDKHYLGLPKYSSRREIGQSIQSDKAHDDRGLLTFLLQAGELTRPMRLENPDQPWHLPKDMRVHASSLVDEIISGLGDIFIFYYKPHDWLPALRIETAKEVALNPHRLAVVVQGLKYQCAVPSILEPYPLYLADRTVKALARAVPTFRQVATQRLSERYEGDIGEVFFAMHGYRSESGR
ncbi:MAG TPA: nuclease [Desulfobacterales bacterium]|nr:nuclease [Desulfobacterales bacterium]